MNTTDIKVTNELVEEEAQQLQVIKSKLPSEQLDDVLDLALNYITYCENIFGDVSPGYTKEDVDQLLSVLSIDESGDVVLYYYATESLGYEDKDNYNVQVTYNITKQRDDYEWYDFESGITWMTQSPYTIQEMASDLPIISDGDIFDASLDYEDMDAASEALLELMKTKPKEEINARDLFPNLEDRSLEVSFIID